MIIEITGVPGVGKTSLIEGHYSYFPNEIAERASLGQKSLIVFSDELAVLDLLSRIGLPTQSLGIFLARKSLLARVLGRGLGDLILYCVLALHIGKHYKFLLWSLPKLARLPEKTLAKLNILRSIILRIGRFEYVLSYLARLQERGLNCAIVFDEGVTHIPYNLIDYRGVVNLDVIELFTKMQHMTKQIVLVQVKAKGVDIAERLKLRGHKRLKTSSQYSLEDFVAVNAALEAQYENLPKSLFLETHTIESGDCTTSKEQFANLINRTD